MIYRLTIKSLICNSVFIFMLFIATATATGAKPALQVVASFSILADMAKNVGGNYIKVTTLVGVNSDAHIYRPTPKDAMAIAKSHVVIINGLGFEGWITRLLDAGGFTGQLVVATNGITLLSAASSNNDYSNASHTKSKGYDPHAWQSLTNGQQYVTNIMRGLSLADPRHRAIYHRNGRIYIDKIAALHRATKQTVLQIPQQMRKVIVSHNSFQYFSNEYDIKFFAPVGLSTESSLSARRLAGLIRIIKQENISAIFLEKAANKRLLQQIARETGATIGGVLYADALSLETQPANTYLNLFRHNVSELTKAWQH